MKKLFFLILVLIFGKSAFCQYPVTQNLGSSSTLVQVPANGGLKSLFVNRPLADTTEANTTNLKYYPGAQFFAANDTVIWLRNSNATKWIQLFSNTSGGGGTPSDTLIWHVSGNGQTVVNSLSGGGIGTANIVPLWFITSGAIRVQLPAAGMILSNDTTSNKIMTFNPSTKNWGYSNWVGGGSSSTPTWDAVMGVDSVSSHKAGIGSITSNLIGRLHIQTNNLLNTPNDSSGVYLQNSTAATTTNRVQMSPSIVWEGYAWKNTGSLSQKHLWRADVLPVNSTVIPSTSKWRLSVNPAAAGYYSAFEVGQGFINIYSSTGSLGTINSVQMGSVSPGIYYGTSYPTTTTGTINISVGNSTLSALKSGSNNVAVGNSALAADTSGSINTAIGHYALNSNTNGEQNVAVGFNALLNNIGGQKNTAVGAGAMENYVGISPEGFNSAFSHDAFLHLTRGQYNTGMGYLVYSTDTAGSYNVGLGYSAGRSMIGGSGNTMIGSNSGYSDGDGRQLAAAKYSIGLGYKAYTTADFQFALSDTINRMKARGMGRGVVGYAMIDTTGNGDIALKSLATYGTNIYNSDGTLTGDRILTGGGHDLSFSGVNDFVVTGTHEAALGATDGVSLSQVDVTAASSLIASLRNPQQSTIEVFPDSISIRPGQAKLYIDSLTQGLSTDSLLSWQPSTGLVRKIDPARIGGNTIYTGNGVIPGGANRIVDFTGAQLNFTGGIFNFVGTNNSLVTTSGANTAVIGLDGTQVGISATNGGTNASELYATGDSLIHKGQDGQSFYTSGVNRMTIANNGNTTIGTGAVGGYLFSVGSTAYPDGNINVQDSIMGFGDPVFDVNGTAITIDDRVGQGAILYNAYGVGHTFQGNVGIGTTPGTTTLSVAGSLALGYVEKTTTYVVAASDYTINCTSGTFTVTLPTAVGITGRVYVIKNTGAGTVTIDGDGTETIDGSLTQALNIQYASLTVQSTGTGWIIL